MRTRPWLRWILSIGAFGALALWLEPSRIAAEVAGIHPAWLLLALAAATAQTVLSAWRWRFTAHRLGLELSASIALKDYYLSGFVNQILPGGVLGDAWRAQRHARSSGCVGPAWRAVILERASGQLVVILLAVLALLVYTPWREALSAAPWPEPYGLALSVPMALGILVYLLRRRWQPWLAVFGQDMGRALLARQAWPLQLGGSVLIVLSYLLVFALAGRGIGLDLTIPNLMLLALPVLLAMLIPLSVAGWGLREGAAAGIWLLSGLPPEQGVATSIAYGLLVLLASLPGALVLVLRPSTQVHVDQ